MTVDVACAPLLTVLVLSDGQEKEAAATAAAARSLTPSVQVLERRPDHGRGNGVVAVDWADGERAASFLAGVTERWILVLAAGEQLAVRDAAETLRHLENLEPAAVQVATENGGEVRLHPAGPEALEHIGARSAVHLPGLAILPAAPAAIAVAPVEDPPGAPAASPVPEVPADDAATEALRQRLAAVEETRLTHLARGGRDVCWLESDDDDEPLVTIRIATYNRGQLIADRALASAISQTYERLEILVVGDACDEATEAAVRSVGDPRIRFVNLPVRGTYPTGRMHRWMVAGAAPMNAALALARGAWIAPCDDDDELTPDHVEVLLGEAKRRRLEWVYSKARCETEPGRWMEIGSEPLQHGHISHGSVLYSLGLRHFQHSATCWKLDEPGDWNLWYRMRDAGVRMGFVDEVTYVHFLEAYKREAGDSGQIVEAVA